MPGLRKKALSSLIEAQQSPYETQIRTRYPDIAPEDFGKLQANSCCQDVSRVAVLFSVPTACIIGAEVMSEAVGITPHYETI